MLRQIGSRNQITLPRKLLAALGAKPMDFVRIEKKGGALILVPVSIESKMGEREWGKLKAHLDKEKKGARYVSASEAKKQIDSL